MIYQRLHAKYSRSKKTKHSGLKIFSLFLLNLVPCLIIANETSSTKILSISLPTTIANINSRYGLPSKFEPSDPEDPSPWGQWFHWTIKSEGVILTALADDYEQTPNYNAEVRMISIKAINPHKNITSVYGHTINKTKMFEIQQSHRKTIQKSIRYTLKHIDNNIWTYYLCDKQDRLIQIIQSTFDIDVAD